MPLRRIATCIAIATWCFLNTWVEFAEGQSSYYDRYDPLYAVVVPVLIWEALLTLGLYAAWVFFSKRQPARWPHALFLIFCYIPIGIAAVAALRAVPAGLIPIIHKAWFVPAAIVVAILPVLFALTRIIEVSRLLRSMFLYSWPVLAIILIRAGLGPALKHPRESYQEGALAKPLTGAAPPIRVVWIIFDELSQSIAFTHRPAGLALPNFDRLKSESFYASAATAPGHLTAVSIPSLILGDQVTAVTPAAPDRLTLRTVSHPEPFSWGSVSNIFDQARESGFNSAIVGWFHPYGRLLNRSVTQCAWIAAWLNGGAEEPTEPQSLLQAMRSRAFLQLNALPLVGHLPGVYSGRPPRRAKIERFEYLKNRTLALAADPSIGLLFIHLPTPHPPAIFDRRAQAMTDSGNVSYLDGVALADRTLGEIRHALAKAGLQDRTALIVSADHGWRTYMWRADQSWTEEDEGVSHGETAAVPFLVKLPGKSAEVDYDKPFATIVTRKLILEILSGRLIEPSSIPAL